MEPCCGVIRHVCRVACRSLFQAFDQSIWLNPTRLAAGSGAGAADAAAAADGATEVRCLLRADRLPACLACSSSLPTLHCLPGPLTASLRHTELNMLPPLWPSPACLPTCRDEQSHEAEALLHELLLQRLRHASAGDSNTSADRHQRASRPGEARPGGSGGTADASAEEATLAPHLHQHQQRQQQPEDRRRPASAPVPGDLLRQQQQQQQQHEASSPGPERQLLLPPVATRLPPHMQQHQQGGSADHTPMSVHSIESAWSDSGGRAALLSAAGSRRCVCCCLPRGPGSVAFLPHNYLPSLAVSHLCPLQLPSWRQLSR